MFPLWNHAWLCLLLWFCRFIITKKDMLFSVRFELTEIWDQITNKTLLLSTLSDVCMCVYFKCVKCLLSYRAAVFPGFLMKSVMDGIHNRNEDIQGAVSAHSFSINKDQFCAVLGTWILDRILTAGLELEMNEDELKSFWWIWIWKKKNKYFFTW